ncbi:DUF5620 domain-containing protein [Porcipelethomonas sp.]|uniref:DUF5620 domain-containing protein n=1 Tax=Porcipelethomonas sp. TaxID=2981675 RepID=UPI003EF915ED
MVKTKFAGRIKAAVISAAMIATAFITPAVTSFNSVTAATTISVNKTLIADGLTTSDSKKNTQVPVTLGTETKTLTFNFETDFTNEVTVGISGFTINSSPWWTDVTDGEIKVTPTNGKFSVTYTIPSTIDKSSVTGVDVGIWYPKTNEEFTLTTMEMDASGTTGGGSTSDPIVTKNNKSGTCTFKDNGDGTADITSTLTAEISEPFSYLLTAGYDEEMYQPINTDPDAPVLTDDSPINSHKFKFTEFGIEEIENVTFQSFNYIVESEVDMKRFMYGGGINVTPGSPADTEKVKGKNGYWYNDQGEQDVETYGGDFLIDDYGTGYTVEGVGTYAKLVWDVPASVQEYVTKGATDSVGFQFWYGQQDTEEYAEIETVKLTGASCTYTRTMTVPYNTTITKKTNQKLTTGSDTTNQIKINLADLGLKERDKLSAIKFTVSGSNLEKMQFGVGISVDLENALATDGWYQPNNITVLDDSSRTSYEIMWILPEVVRSDVDLISDLGNVMFGYWYGGDAEGNEIASVTLDSVDFYTFQSKEAELEVTPSELNLTVGETAQLKTNVTGCTFEAAAATGGTYFTVDENGNVEALAAGAGTITVTTPEGQETVITVIVKAAATTSTSVTTTTPVITTTTVTTVDPDGEIDWNLVKYGDVNLDGNVSAADVVLLNKYLLSPTEYSLINATARENANAHYDFDENGKGLIDLTDSSDITSVVLEVFQESELGPQK